jgi:phosphorylase kinase alpha/beta subunit
MDTGSTISICLFSLQLTISVWGKEEEVIDKPVSPNDIKKILYDRCFPFDIIQAVLQQELIINIGTFMTTNPEYFQGILKIRIGYEKLSFTH